MREIDQTTMRNTLANTENYYLQESSSNLSITPTLKSQGVRILRGGIKAGGGGEDWLSKEMPKLSLI